MVKNGSKDKGGFTGGNTGKDDTPKRGPCGKEGWGWRDYDCRKVVNTK